MGEFFNVRGLQTLDQVLLGPLPHTAYRTAFLLVTEVGIANGLVEDRHPLQSFHHVQE